ncbi:SH3 domain-containing protein [Clostridium perfringens]|uniref:SH3 domain-containing protein n=1 Tax=Clostridium perfringens TaxID=1502 RepID=UPI00210AE75C|nr:SH3 domain-containing protein [Clostridium perfringens]
MKRKKLSIFILSAAIVTSSVSYGMAAKADEVKETKGYNYNVNLSEQKGVANNKISVKKVNGEILGYANPFTMLQILNVNGKTVEVITQSGLRGYVDADEFTLVESAVNDKLIEKNIEGHVTNVSTALNLRKEPRIGAEIIDRLLNNTKVNILGKQGSWYKIELNGQKGYVYGMFLNEGTKKENSSKAISNKKSEVKSEGKKEKKSSVKAAVKKEAKKEVVSGAKAKVAQTKREEAKANITSEVKPVINKEAKSNNKVEVKSEVNKETNNEVKTEMNLAPKAEGKAVSTSEVVQAVNPEVKSENNLETNLQVRPEIKSEEKTEMISKENLNVIPEAKKEEVSEEIKPEINTEVESKPEMNKEVKAEEVKTAPEVKPEEKQEVKPVEVSEEKVEAKEEVVKVEEKVELKKEPKQEEVQDPKAKEMDELLKSEEYKFLRMSISYGGRLVDRKDIYTKDSLKVLGTELEKAKKVFQDKDNLTMKLVEDTRYDLDKAIVDLVKLSDVKKPARSKAKVEVKKESNTEKKEEVKAEEGKTAPEVKLEKKQEAKPVEASEEKVEQVKVEEKVELKKEPKQEEVQDPKAKEMEELLKSEEYKFLRMSISYGERLLDRNDIYTKDSLKVLGTELEKAKKVFQDKDNLTMQLVEDTRYDLDKAIVDLVKLSDIKKPARSKAKVSEEKVEPKKEVKEQVAKAEVMVPEVKENKEIKKEEPVKAKEVVKEKKSREEEIEEILKSEEYRFLLKDIAYGERLSEKITVYTRESLKVLNAAIEKAGRIVREKEKLTVKLVQDTRDDVDRAIVDLVKKIIKVKFN